MLTLYQHRLSSGCNVCAEKLGKPADSRVAFSSLYFGVGRRGTQFTAPVSLGGSGQNNINDFRSFLSDDRLILNASDGGSNSLGIGWRIRWGSSGAIVSVGDQAIHVS
jgi:hypothetical protein